MVKEDFEPLLGPGRHVMTLDRLKELTTPIENSDKRLQIFNHLVNLEKELSGYEVRIDLWIDGSFLTKKPDPLDIDGCIVIHADEYDSVSSEVRNVLDQYHEEEEPKHGVLDMFLYIYYNTGDIRNKIEEKSWEEQWSTEHRGPWLKGYACIPVGGTKYELF